MVWSPDQTITILSSFALNSFYRGCWTATPFMPIFRPERLIRNPFRITIIKIVNVCPTERLEKDFGIFSPPYPAMNSRLLER